VPYVRCSSRNEWVITGLPTPISECPYLHTDSNYAQILNVGFSFKNDGSCRLVRDIAFDSPARKLLYHRARNATFERWGLKRLPVYGMLRTRAVIFLADVRSNLTTLARLFREATAATGA